MGTTTEIHLIQPVLAGDVKECCQGSVKKIGEGPKTVKRLPFELVYRVGDVIGKGGFGTVYAGLRALDGEAVAIKHVAKNKVTDWTMMFGRRVPMELKLLNTVQGVEGVIKLLDFYERSDSFIYVMERPSDCKDMFDFITEKSYWF